MAVRGSVRRAAFRRQTEPFSDRSQPRSGGEPSGEMIENGTCYPRRGLPREGATAIGCFTGFITRGPMLARRILEAGAR
jgi:hypothetical protein